MFATTLACDGSASGTETAVVAVYVPTASGRIATLNLCLHHAKQVHSLGIRHGHYGTMSILLKPNDRAMPDISAEAFDVPAAERLDDGKGGEQPELHGGMVV